MPDITLLVSEIRAFLQRDDQTLNDRLTELARQYADECATVNSRLAMCSRLLSQGLRSEAIQQSEADPNLLDLVTALDFPERTDWESLADMYGLSRPPELLMAIASELNQAYAEENPLRDLLKQHRRLALMRAPLAKRTAVLAQIAAQDVSNPVWNLDLTAYQKVRLAEIKEEATVAVKAGNRVAVDELHREVAGGVWVDPPSPALVKGLEQANALLTRNEARAALPRLESALQDAVVQSHIKEARRLENEWRETISRAALTANDPIRQRMLPALEWIALQNQRDEQRQEFDADVAGLEAALRDDAPLDHVMDLVAQVGTHEREVPADLVARYEARLNLEDRRKRMVRYGTIGACAAAAGLIFAWIGYSSWHSGRSKLASRQASIIDQALAKHDIESAQTLIMQLKSDDPGLLSFASLDEAWTRFDQAQAEETKRANDLAVLVAGMEQGLTLPRVEVDMAKARTLVRTASERAGIAALEQKREQLLVKAQADIDAALGPQIEAVLTGLDTVEDLLKSDRAVDAAGELTVLSGKIRGLREQISEAGPKVKVRGEEFLRRLSVTQQAVSKAAERQLAQEELSKAVMALPGQVEGYVSALDRYRLTLPAGAIMNEADRTLAERAAWSSALAECQLQVSWRTEARRQLNPGEAINRLADLKNAEMSLEGSPDHESLAEYRSYLKAVADRAGPAGLPRLERMTVDPLLSRVRLIHLIGAPNKERFYTTDSIDKNTTSFKYIIDYNADRTRTRSAIQAGMDKFDMAPQVAFAQALKDVLPGLKDGSLSWESTFPDLLDQVRENQEIDPILRVDLIDALMQVGTNGSPALMQVLEEFQRYRTAIKIKRGLRWMNPDDDSASEDRSKAEEGLKRFPAFGRVVETAKADATKRELPGRSLPAVLGWLQHGRQGYHCHAIAGGSEPGDLFVVVPAAPGGRWVRVGEWRDGVAKLDQRNPQALQEGRLVFFRPEASK